MKPRTQPHPSFLKDSAIIAAEALIGWQLVVREPDGSRTGGIIIETEAYNQDDAASHSYRGRTPRTDVMFGPSGKIYVYFTYGMHWCMNIVVGPDGRGEAVLLRALLPVFGLDTIRARRPNATPANLTNGPAKLCQALGVTGADNGLELNRSKFELTEPKQRYTVRATTRIGITRDTHRLWRFVAVTNDSEKVR